MAEQSPLTSYELNGLIEISSEYTPINFPSKRNSFTTDLNDVPTVAASDVTEITLSTRERSNCESLQCLCPSASSSTRQPAAASIIECHKSVANVQSLELRETGAMW